MADGKKEKEGLAIILPLLSATVTSKVFFWMESPSASVPEQLEWAESQVILVDL